MIAVDSSVAIAGFASWHERHTTAMAVFARKPRLIAHAALETYSVLTRLPPPHRAPGGLVGRFLQHSFGEPLLCLPDARYQGLIATLVSGQIVGGQVYDALIGLTAAEHGATLISFDQRATLIYETVGVAVEQPG
jgi:hypothetical protein